jgi:hypothetical protein
MARKSRPTSVSSHHLCVELTVVYKFPHGARDAKPPRLFPVHTIQSVIEEYSHATEDAKPEGYWSL